MTAPGPSKNIDRTLWSDPFAKADPPHRALYFIFLKHNHGNGKWRRDLLGRRRQQRSFQIENVSDTPDKRFQNFRPAVSWSGLLTDRTQLWCSRIFLLVVHAPRLGLFLCEKKKVLFCAVVVVISQPIVVPISCDRQKLPPTTRPLF